MTPKKLNSVEEKRHALQTLAGDTPSCLNFHDLLIRKTDAQLDPYTFHSISGALVVLSPDRTLSVYAANEAGVDEAFEKAVELGLTEKATLILGPATLAAKIKKHQITYKRFNPFFYMRLESPFDAIDNPTYGNSVFRRAAATAMDLQLVQNWYKAFNEESKAAWEPPPMEELTEKKLYFLFHDFQAKAFCANTLENDERFWVGRLFVAKADRRKGFAGEIMAHVLRLAAQENKSIDLQVNSDNELGIQFYQGLGLTTVCENAYWAK